MAHGRFQLFEEILDDDQLHAAALLNRFEGGPQAIKSLGLVVHGAGLLPGSLLRCELTS